ncbi:FtsK/SpoIIIE domain-containing protein [Actinoallomurus oryzae]|uniref:FtsK/SpoIIIE domain-containing protein n=1 Tax=Actinoallomurus oryzae TaxID=502180 RepID=A0ABP8PB63_9ACTN
MTNPRQAVPAEDGDTMGDLIPLRPARTEPEQDTHYEVTLDEEAAPDAVLVQAPEPVGERHPIIPAELRGWSTIKATTQHTAGRWAHQTGYHAVRAPRYALLGCFWAGVGVFRLIGRHLRWWWVTEQYGLRQSAADRHDPEMWMKLHREVKATRAWRGLVLLGEAFGVAVATGEVAAGPAWLTVAVLAGITPALARVGRPSDRRIISPAVVTPRFRKLNPDIVLRAYYAAKLGDPDKPGQQVHFGSTMSRDGNGSRVLIDLPHGKGLDDAIKAKPAIASGLDVSLSQVFITRDPTSHRRHVLWVADRDPLAIPAGRTPLLACKPTDIWAPAPFGLDERGNRVAVEMMWNSILVGAQPRQGKTFSARALALYAALDPYVKLSVFDGKGSPDWRKFRLVADRCAFGLAMTRDGDPVELFIDSLREIKADVQDRYQRLSELPVDVCPEGKLTREIARDPRYRMPVRLVVIDEFQEYFDLPDPDATKEVAALLVFLVKVAPAAGVIVLGATQKPSGIGSGQVAQQFNAFRDNHQIRFSLRTGSWQVSDLVLGSGAYSEGYDSSTLLPDYKGVGILRGASDATPTVRTHLADAQDAEKILTAARAYRQRARTLTGMAAGEEVTREVRDVLADVRGIYKPGERGLHWQQIAARLADAHPEHYADLTADAISAQVRAFGVPSVDVKRHGVTLKGARADAINTAIQRRADR